MEQTTLLDSAAHQIVQLALAVLVPLLVALAVRALKKVGISIDADRQAQLEYFAKQAAAHVEEAAAAQVKAGLGRIAGKTKLDRAVSSVLERLPNVTQEEATHAVQAALPQIGAGAASGVIALGKAMRTAEPKQ